MVEVTLDGIDDVLRALQVMPLELEKRILGEALRPGAELIEKAAKEKCPVYEGPASDHVKPGQLRDSIHTRKSSGSGSVGYRIETGEGDFVGDEFYAPMVEFGHKIGKRGGGKYHDKGGARAQVPAHPFMRPAMDENRERVTEMFKTAVAEAVERLWGK